MNVSFPRLSELPQIFLAKVSKASFRNFLRVRKIIYLYWSKNFQFRQCENLRTERFQNLDTLGSRFGYFYHFLSLQNFGELIVFPKSFNFQRNQQQRIVGVYLSVLPPSILMQILWTFLSHFNWVEEKLFLMIVNFPSEQILLFLLNVY